ncbi:hypothetical protein CYD30_20890 [Kosakonia cowanii]|nr:hypothetical protein CYD30_20890 [Kosakonia cowanii]
MAHFMTTREVIELLQRRNPDECLLAEFWYTEDVLFRACKQAREASEFLLNLSVSDSAKAA